MNKYEILYIVENSLDDEAKAAVCEKFENAVVALGGTVANVDKWGTKKFAYPIDYKTEGYYVLVNFQAEAELPKELERNLQISDSVIRYQVIKQLERKAGVKPRPVRVAPAAPVAPAAEAPVETPAAE